MNTINKRKIMIYSIFQAVRRESCIYRKYSIRHTVIYLINRLNHLVLINRRLINESEITIIKIELQMPLIMDAYYCVHKKSRSDYLKSKIWNHIGDEYTVSQKEQLVVEIEELSNLIIDFYLETEKEMERQGKHN